MQLAAANLTAGYDTQDVLHSLSLYLSAGEFVGLLGQNGCGKSTLLRAITHTLPLRSGSVTLDGKPLTQWTTLERAQRIAFVPQKEPTHFEFTVYDVVLMGRYPHTPRGSLTENDFQSATRAMQETDILPLAERLITELSGGEHRRVLLARALAQETPLLLLDEPIAHLDIAHQISILDKIRSLAHSQNRGALAALHDLNQAAEFCDRLILMEAGRILAEGTPNEVLTTKNLRAAYHIDAEIATNPKTGRPYLLHATTTSPFTTH